MRLIQVGMLDDVLIASEPPFHIFMKLLVAGGNAQEWKKVKKQKKEN